MNYDLDENDKLPEEVATVFGVPFEVIPFKQTQGPSKPRPKNHHIQAVPEKAHLEIQFPRVDGYTQAIRNRVSVNWENLPKTTLMPGRIPPEVQMKGMSLNNQGRNSPSGPGELSMASLAEFREQHRLQELIFELTAGLTKYYVGQGHCEAPPHVLFPQLQRIVTRYVFVTR